ncbi:hypothetical protein RM407_003816 [Enterobacter kobei]|nr:hypothetical protein [Enterobacter kobei]
MSFSKYINSETADFINMASSVLKVLREERHEYNKAFGINLRKEINEMPRGRIKATLRAMESEKVEADDDYSFECAVLAKVFFVLEAHGFKNIAKDLGTCVNTNTSKELSQDLIFEKIAENAARKSRSVAASAPRHPQKDEILDVMRATWRTYPWASKNKMILRVTESYRVAEKTLKNWMSEEGLKPLEKVKNKKFHLVIPDRWKK